MLDVAKSGSNPRVAIVGAGLAGLMAARMLRDECRVTVFEKRPVPGGRCTTYRSMGIPIDHGAQYLTVRSATLEPHLARWQATGLIQPWEAPLGATGKAGEVNRSRSDLTRYVACPGMDALAKALCHGLEMRFDTEVAALSYTGNWSLQSRSGPLEQGFDTVVLALPYGALTRLADKSQLPQEVLDPVMAPCWATLAAFHQRIDSRFGGLFVNDGPLGWLALNHTKPGRSATASLVLHANPSWSRQHAQTPREEVTHQLLVAADRLLDLPKATQSASTFWPEARALSPLTGNAYAHADLPLVVCGDWCAGNRIEGALLSGIAAAQRVGQFLKV